MYLPEIKSLQLKKSNVFLMTNSSALSIIRNKHNLTLLTTYRDVHLSLWMNTLNNYSVWKIDPSIYPCIHPFSATAASFESYEA